MAALLPAVWHGPNPPGVVRQLREARDLESAHAFELEDGRVVVDHVDAVNPDGALPLAPLVHLVVDYPPARALSLAVLGGWLLSNL